METFKMETAKPEINFAKESSDVWNRIVAQVVDQAVLEVAAPMKEVNVDEAKMEAVRTTVEEELHTSLEKTPGL